MITNSDMHIICMTRDWCRPVIGHGNSYNVLIVTNIDRFHVTSSDSKIQNKEPRKS